MNVFNTALSTGAVGLYGEAGTIARFDDIRVRKYGSPEPIAALCAIHPVPLLFNPEDGVRGWASVLLLATIMVSIAVFASRTRQT